MRQSITYDIILNENHAWHRDSRSHERESDGTGRRLLETILAGPHDLVLSEFLPTETARVLGYPRLQKLYRLTPQDIAEHVELLRARADLVNAAVYKPIVLTGQCRLAVRRRRTAGVEAC